MEQTDGTTIFDAIGSEVFVTYHGRMMRYCVMPSASDAILFANAKNNEPGATLPNR